MDELTVAQVVLAGRPNVGKSSIFNKLIGKALALVDETPGLTRDRKMATLEVDGRAIELVDTPGLEEADSATITGRMRAQTEQAVQTADLILFVIDGRAGLTPLDEYYAAWLRAQKKPIVLIVNKCEGKGGQAGMMEAYSLGFGEPIGISAAHNDGLDMLRGYVLETLQGMKAWPDVIEAYDDEDGETVAISALSESEEDDADDEIALDPDIPTIVEGVVADWKERPLMLAIVGRPNAGKSTLVNALLGEDRME